MPVASSLDRESRLDMETLRVVESSQLEPGLAFPEQNGEQFAFLDLRDSSVNPLPREARSPALVYAVFEAFSRAVTSESRSNVPSYRSPLMKNVGVPFTPLRRPPR